MAYNDPALNINSTLSDWPIGGRPALTWSAPTAAADHIIVWWNTVPDWASASNISGSLSGSATSYTDAGSAVADGSENYYWVIAYNAGETLTGRNNGCLACQNDVSVSGVTITGVTNVQVITPMAFTTNAQASGDFRSTFDVTCGAWTEGFPAPTADPTAGIPYPPGAAFFEGALSCSRTIGGAVFQANNLGQGIDPPGPPGAYQFNAAAGFNSISLGEGDAFLTTITGSGPTTMFIVIQALTPGGWGLTGAPPFAEAQSANCGASGHLSYTHPSASLVTGGAGPGGAADLPPVPVVNIQYLEMPLPIPLPCVPCCSTAAPICDCSSNHDH